MPSRSRGRSNGTLTISPTVAAGPLVIMTMRSASNNRFVDVVGHHEHRLMFLLRTARINSSCSSMRVTTSSKLNGSSSNKHLRLQRQGARDADALAHAGGKLVGIAIGGAV